MARGEYTIANHFTEGTNPGATPPFTCLAWANHSALAAAQVLWGINDTGSVHKHELRQNAAGTLSCLSTDGGGASAATCSNTIGTGSWNAAAGIWTTGSARSAILAGDVANKGGVAAAKAPTLTTPRMGIGIRGDNTYPVAHVTGLLAWVTLYNEALSDDECAAHAGGVCPLLIRPSAIMRCWPLWLPSGDEQDLTSGGVALTQVGTVPAGSSDAPIGMPWWGSTNTAGMTGEELWEWWWSMIGPGGY